MRKIYSLFLALSLIILGITTEGYSIPAYPGEVEVTQKDGTTIKVRIYGDEFFNYYTTIDGYVISRVDEVFYYADILFDGKKIATNVKAKNPGKRTRAERVALSTRPVASSIAHISGVHTISKARKLSNNQPQKFPSTGKHKFVAILANYTDVKFTSASANADFSSMLNDVDYSNNNGTGSARDYFIDNSGGLFTPEFVVIGPVELPQKMAYYGAPIGGQSDSSPQQMIVDACAAAVATGVDFSQFDVDNDGVIDNVFVYYAGYNEAEGGSSISVWPHKWNVPGGYMYSGKELNAYACTSEMKGSSGANMAGIGTFTHEFGHVIGLADTYDTISANESQGLFSIDVMTIGSYNNGGSTPPYYLAYERDQLGWLTPIEITKEGHYELKDISKNEAYIIPTSVKDEVVYLEFHNGEDASIIRNWNKHIGSSVVSPELKAVGLLVTHIDKSENDAGGITAKERWATNVPNNNKQHECGKFIYSGGFQYPGNIQTDSHKTYFPGKNNVTSFGFASEEPAKDWSGKDINVNLENIRVEGNVLKFTNITNQYFLSSYSNAASILFRDMNTSWQIKWKKASDSDSEFVTIPEIKIKDFYISGLMPSTKYTIVIDKIEDGNSTESTTETITTAAINGDFPTMLISNNTERIFNAALNNFTDDYANVKWYFNGTEVANDLTYSMEKGENNIVCEINNNGVIDKIYKILNVQ